uniref:Glycerophosphodiester phosphodiesterase 1 n=1 Tax=Laticauda laticaudata TaxID=8630 RepID=A0A8C5RF84_LATLA
MEPLAFGICGSFIPGSLHEATGLCRACLVGGGWTRGPLRFLPTLYSMEPLAFGICGSFIPGSLHEATGLPSVGHGVGSPAWAGGVGRDDLQGPFQLRPSLSAVCTGVYLAAAGVRARGGGGGGPFPRQGRQRPARLLRRSPWLCKAGRLQGSLHAAGGAVQQRLRLRPAQRADWAQTRPEALVALTFHANFSYLAEVGCDRLVGAPVAILAFYSGMRLLQGKEDIFTDCRQKFWNTYQTGLMYWPFVQLSNFSFVPVFLRTAFTGFCGFLWAIFLCFSQQSGDGTATSVFKLFHEEKAAPGKTSSGK